MPLSQQRVKARDDAWHSHDEVLDFYGSVQGRRLWEESRRGKTRCGILAFDGIVY